MQNITIDWTGAGHYWLSDGDGSIDLGECDTDTELRDAIQQVIDQGDADWTGWTASR